jgi:hypothetical protein
MTAPTVPFYGKDTDRLARLTIACKVLADSGPVLDDWPGKVANHEVFKTRIDAYQSAFEDAIHYDRRAIAQRTTTCNLAGSTWQKIVNYLSATEEDNSQLLELMGVVPRARRGPSSAAAELQMPDLSVVNLDEKGAVRAFCPYERRRYTYDIWVTDGDPRIEEGWHHRSSFGDCTKMDMPGYQSGKEYSFRCRIIGRDNKVGPWSHTITIMVT